MKLLWVDNDYLTPLNPLSKRLEKKGFFLIKFGSYEETLQYIDKSDFDDVSSVLLDVIIPANTKCLSYAGFEIAKAIAKKRHIKSLAFLSVVLKDEIRDQYSQLEQDFTGVKFKYVDKAQLLEPSIFIDLIDFLKNSENK